MALTEKTDILSGKKPIHNCFMLSKVRAFIGFDFEYDRSSRNQVHSRHRDTEFAQMFGTRLSKHGKPSRRAGAE
ncbi:MAG: hypothetical protein LAN84_03740 [Acidobacteriia bacterium]|nr:hypothetical protein [Terriglobia bacterium]